MASTIKNIKGQKFNWLTVLELSYCKVEAYWKCVCECGNETVVSGTKLRSGHTKSCGCYRGTHRSSNSRLYQIWENMIARCTNRKAPNFHNYGGRGILINTEWLNNFSVFQQWALTNGYTEFLTLDRKDNNGSYAPDNCRWATQEEQKYNTRRNVLIEIDGEILNTKQVLEKYNFKKKSLYYLFKKDVPIHRMIEIIKQNGKTFRISPTNKNKGIRRSSL